MSATEKRVVLITGASSGMGKEMALTLVRQGRVVYGAARRVERMRDLVEAGGHALELDVTNEAQIRNVVARILEESGRIDVLVNNAGFAVYGAVEDTSIEDARRQFEVNLFGVAAVTRAVLPPMRRQKSGRIINVPSMGGKLHSPFGAWYHASKHALEGWSDCLRVETAQFGIDVVVEPGAIATEFGTVLGQPMLDRSGEGAYGAMTMAVARATRTTYERPGGSSPASVVADTVSKAILARRPKTRYVVGKYARPPALSAALAQRSRLRRDHHESGQADALIRPVRRGCRRSCDKGTRTKEKPRSAERQDVRLQGMDGGRQALHARLSRTLAAREDRLLASRLRRQVIRQNPEWPNDQERRDDIAAHTRLSGLLRRAGPSRGR